MKDLKKRTGSMVMMLAFVASSHVFADSRQVIVYDSFEKPGGYSLDDYLSKWSNPRGLQELGSSTGDTRFFRQGKFEVRAIPFRTASDIGVSDHSKYLAISKQAFPVPDSGSVVFSTTIQADTPDTIPDRIIKGTYIQTGKPYAQKVLEGQQASAVMNMINLETGQLFDWFVSGNTAFTLIERLPSSVTRSPRYVGRDKMYTQIIDEVKIEPGPHTYSIKYTRDANDAMVEYLLDGKVISNVGSVGVPLDVQGHKYSGLYPALGKGEKLVGDIDSFVIGHGLFSLLDPFPYQHAEAPELNVSIPLENRTFGQGAKASFGPFTVVTEEKGNDN